MGATQPPDFSFPLKVKAALHKLGFKHVFLDVASMAGGDMFEGRIHNAIADCDLFVELIGLDWKLRLDEKAQSGEPDVLLMEIMSAISLDKDIAPLLVDGATMPAASTLPKTIEELAVTNAKPAQSSMSVDELAEVLRAPAREAGLTRRLGRGWSVSYAILATLAWCITAIVPNLVGYREYGHDAWSGMAAAWAGFFIWPLFFMPFILVALFKPIKILFEAALNAPSLRDTIVFLSPILIGFVLALVVTLEEVKPPQVPWTVHPQTLEICRSGPPDAGPENTEDKAQYFADRKRLAGYGQTEAFKRKFGREFWMKNKCWPNVFFYLTAPVSSGVVDSLYDEERTQVVEAMRRILAVEALRQLTGTDAPYSRVFWFYALSFFTIIWLMISAILIAIIYSVVAIRRSRDGKILQVPTEDTFLCLTYAFITLMVWTPFRISTVATKQMYTCLEGPLGCGLSSLSADVYKKDGFLAVALLVAYCFLTVGMLWNHKRILIAFFGTVVVSAVSFGSYMMAKYRGALTDFTEDWGFWMVGSIVVSIIMIGLWYLYDPALVRLRDVRRAARRERNAARKKRADNVSATDKPPAP